MEIINGKRKSYQVKYCEICGKKLIKKSNVSISTYNKRKTCSRECGYKLNSNNKSTMVVCSYCGKTFKRKNFSIKKNKKNFCNKACLQKYNNQIEKTMDVVCCNCNKIFKKRKSELHTEKNFCSRKCMGEWQSKNWVGKNANNYKGDIDYNLYNSDYSCFHISSCLK